MIKTTTYYEWNQELTSPPVLLGDSVRDYVENGTLIKQDDEKYSGKDEFPWIVTVYNETIVHICYRSKFPDIPGFEEIWMRDPDYFHSRISTLLKTIDQIDDFRGDVLTTVFRDNSISIACFSRKPFDNSK